MKRILASTLAAVLLLTVVLSVPLPASAESMYIRKIVSVVYDDSGSMDQNKWAYANYAMQTFCGMLNSEDQLIITYMSEWDGWGLWSNKNPNPGVDLSAGKIQSSVDSIRSHTDTSGTPYAAVETAFERLKSVNDSNPNTQYWLVVITDGQFNDVQGQSKAQQVEFLNRYAEEYTDTVMPNGTKPQVTYLTIGDSSQVFAPEADSSRGIYTYNASNASGIISAMSQLADRVSGRTRLKESDIKQVDDTTIEVSSSIPLLNIAVLAQESDARIVSAICNNEQDIPITRSASLSYPGYSDLNGGAYLLGDSQSVIGDGTYRITFDREVDEENVVVLFEPALEMRMTVTVNGQPVQDIYDLQDYVAEGDEIGVSCKIYEMGTDTEIDPALLPGGTQFEISVLENGSVAQQVTGQEMTLESYIMKQAPTELVSRVVIDGFNPIEFSTGEFTPAKPVPKVVYTMTADYGSDIRSVKLDEIASNKDLSICFTVQADGVPLTDPEAVKALNPTVSASPQGNDGTVTYSEDGKIVFTPNSATVSTGASGSVDVNVTCTLADGTTAAGTYTLLISDYQVIPVAGNPVVTKTEFFGNQTGVSFYITKDGVRLEKAEVENDISVSLGEKFADLKTRVDVAQDGTITITPYSEEEHRLNFFSWWVNWWYYLSLPGEDLTVTLEHALGTARSVIDVREEDVLYIILAVALPLILEIAVLAFLIWWLYCILAKPKFAPGTSIFYATLMHAGGEGAECHTIGKMTEIPLAKYNKLKYRLKPTPRAKKISIGQGIVISAGDGESIMCHCPVWYRGTITPKMFVADKLDHPEKVRDYIKKNRRLDIQVLSPFNAAKVKPVASLPGPKATTYYVRTDMKDVKPVNNILAIKRGTIFAYARRKN